MFFCGLKLSKERKNVINLFNNIISFLVGAAVEMSSLVDLRELRGINESTERSASKVQNSRTLPKLIKLKLRRWKIIII